MQLIDVLKDKTQVGERSTELLRQQLAVIRAAKFWQDPYFAIDREVHQRAVRQWVKEDVFGHTFCG